MQKIIGSCVSNICKRFPNLDRQEIHSEAIIAALRGIRAYDPSQKEATLSSYVYRVVANHLNGSVRSSLWRERHAKQIRCSLSESVALAREGGFDIHKLLWQVSEDAQTAIKAALCLNVCKDSLQRILHQHGWDFDRITKVFEEVRQAL